MRTLLKLLLIATLMLAASTASASCRSHTYLIDGRLISCSTCCFGGYCTTSCF